MYLTFLTENNDDFNIFKFYDNLALDPLSYAKSKDKIKKHLNDRGPMGETILHTFFISRIMAKKNWDTDNDAKIVDLINMGANLNAKDSLGKTPLHDAMQYPIWTPRLAHLLYTKGDLDVKDSYGKTPFYNYLEFYANAFYTGQKMFAPEELALFLKRHPVIEWSGPGQITLTQLLDSIFSNRRLAGGDYEHMYALLKKYDIPRDFPDHYHRYDWLTRGPSQKDENIFAFLKKKRPTSMEQRQFITHYKGSFNKVNKKGETPFFFALRLGDTNLAGIIAEFTDCNVNKPDKLGTYPIHYAIELNSDRGYDGVENYELYAVLRSDHADLTVKNREGDPPLTSMVKFYLKHGASNRYLLRAMWSVMRYKNFKPGLLNRKGLTALDVAEEYKNKIDPKDSSDKMLIQRIDQLIQELEDRGEERFNESTSILQKGYLLFEGSNPNDPPIFRAIRSKFFTSAERSQIEDYSGPIDITNAAGETLLHWAANLHERSIVELLLNKGADPNIQKKRTKETPMMWACMGHHQSNALVLLNHGAKLEIEDKNGQTVLFHAVFSSGKDTDLIKELIRHRVNVNHQDNHGNTIFHLYAPRLYPSLELTMKLLVPLGDLMLRNFQGRTPLELAVENKRTRNAELFQNYNKNNTGQDRTMITRMFFDAVQRGDVEEVDKYTGDVNIYNEDDTARPLNGQTPLHIAALKGSPSMVKLLLKKGADPNLPVKEEIRGTSVLKGATAIHLACSSYGMKLEFFEPYSPKWGEKDATGKTPAFYAITRQDIIKLKFLKDHGVDLNEPDSNGATPFDAFKLLFPSSSKGGLLHKEMVLGMRDLDMRSSKEPELVGEVDPKTLFKSIITGDIRLIKHYSGSLDIVNPNTGKTPLETAMSKGNRTILKLLLDKGAPVNKPGRKSGKSPLIYAITRSSWDRGIIEILLQYKADWRAVSGPYQFNAVHWAAQLGYVQAIQVLKKAGADLNVMTRDGRTAYDLAPDDKTKQAIEDLGGDSAFESYYLDFGRIV